MSSRRTWETEAQTDKRKRRQANKKRQAEKGRGDRPRRERIEQRTNRRTKGKRRQADGTADSAMGKGIQRWRCRYIMEKAYAAELPWAGFWFMGKRRYRQSLGR